MTRELVILGSTGSIGVQALEIVEANPNLFTIVAISAAGSNPDLLIEQAKKFKVKVVGVAKNADLIRQALPNVEVIDGPHASTEVAAISCDVVLNGITGSIGLAPTLAALDADNRVALANKESLVAGGDLVLAHGRERIIPVDSEHSALFQALRSGKIEEVNRMVLTASGGPFRNRIDLENVTVEEALNHPTWSMGPVVTINSATMVNKGLEIIEAHYLFGIPYHQLEAVIHPQAIVHSMVEFHDGSLIAQASPPNMKGPIAYAINYPNRLKEVVPTIDWQSNHSWTFEPIDENRFPSIELARRCGALGGSVTAMFNAANEVAVDAFLKKLIPFTAIIETVEKVISRLASSAPDRARDISDVTAIENDARRVALEVLPRG